MQWVAKPIAARVPGEAAATGIATATVDPGARGGAAKAGTRHGIGPLPGCVSNTGALTML